MTLSTAIEHRTATTFKMARNRWSTPSFLGMTGAIFLAMSSTPSPAATLTNGSLSVEIREDNGAIDRILFGGSDFYNPGNPVSDFGFQNGTDTDTFVRNTTAGLTQQPVSVSSNTNSVAVTGTYTGGNANIEFTRTYSLISGLNVLRIKTDFINRGSDIALRYFDTFDPDQGFDRGNGFETYNDTFDLLTDSGLAKVARATELGGLTVTIGSLNSDAIIGQSLGLTIDSGSRLNSFFNTPVDGSGVLSDIGTHVGAFRISLVAGESRSVTYDHAYGISPEAAREQFIRANEGNPVEVPEPASLAGLLVVGAWGAGCIRKSKAGKKAAKSVAQHPRSI